jgi:hypothetical protein
MYSPLPDWSITLGVGKSETGYRIAEAIFKLKTRVGTSRRYLPNGLLVLRGEDYSSASDVAAAGVGEVGSVDE